MNCNDASLLASEAMDHRLGLPRRLGLRVHRMLCRSCDRFSRQLQKLRDILRSYPVDEGGPLDDPQGPCLCATSRDRMEDAIRCELARCGCHEEAKR